MRILFIKPNMGLVRGTPYVDRGRMEPLTFAVLGGFTPPGHDLHLCDDRMEAVPYDEPWDLVGINTEIYTARRAYEIADRFRARGVKVVLGGCHTSLVPEESAPHADAIAIGELDGVWADLVSDAARGALQPRYTGRPGGDLGAFALRFELFQGKRYLPVALGQLSRGCMNACEYCVTGNLYRGRAFVRDPRAVADEFQRRNRKLVFFVDDNLLADEAAARALFQALIPLRLRWTAQASLDFVRDPGLMELMVRSGCAGLVVGFESRDPSNLEAMNKRSNLAYGSYDAVVERIKDAGILLWAAFLLGYDHETASSIRETVDWALAQKFAFSAFNVLTPYPGTAFYARMKTEGRLLYDGQWWLHDDYRFGDAAFRPRNMSPDTLSALGLEARLRHSSLFQILRRATDRRTNAKDLWSLATYFAYNPLFRDEMLKKHGMVLGYRGLERSPSQGVSHPTSV